MRVTRTTKVTINLTEEETADLVESLDDGESSILDRACPKDSCCGRARRSADRLKALRMALKESK